MHLTRVAYVQAVLTGLALCAVWQAAEIRKLGYRLEELRRERDQTAAEAQLCRAHVEKLKSPQRILHLAETLGLHLVECASTVDASSAQQGDAQPPIATAYRLPAEGPD